MRYIAYSFPLLLHAFNSQIRRISRYNFGRIINSVTRITFAHGVSAVFPPPVPIPLVPVEWTVFSKNRYIISVCLNSVSCRILYFAILTVTYLLFILIPSYPFSRESAQFNHFAPGKYLSDCSFLSIPWFVRNFRGYIKKSPVSLS